MVQTKKFPQKTLRRYHHKIYFPNNINDMCVEFFNQLPAEIGITHHAAEEFVKDRKGVIPLPTKKELIDSTNTLVEIYERLDKTNISEGILQKTVIRVHNLNPKVDYTYVLAREGYIVSGWTTSKFDFHRLTHSMNEYYCPDELKNQIYEKLVKSQKDYKNIK